MSDTHPEAQPAWIECPFCGEMWCRIHDLHTHECECPEEEEWAERGLDPVFAGGPPWGESIADQEVLP